MQWPDRGHFDRRREACVSTQRVFVYRVGATGLKWPSLTARCDASAKVHVAFHHNSAWGKNQQGSRRVSEDDTTFQHSCDRMAFPRSLTTAQPRVIPGRLGWAMYTTHKNQRISLSAMACHKRLRQPTTYSHSQSPLQHRPTRIQESDVRARCFLFISIQKQPSYPRSNVLAISSVA